MRQKVLFWKIDESEVSLLLPGVPGPERLPGGSGSKNGLFPTLKPSYKRQMRHSTNEPLAVASHLDRYFPTAVVFVSMVSEFGRKLA